MEQSSFNMILFSELGSICEGILVQLASNGPVTDIIIDSRQTNGSVGSVFFAIGGERHDGHQFITSMYAKGIRHFVIEKDINRKEFAEGNFVLVSSSIHSLQLLATHHRKQFTIPIVGITGSNGKTIIKEWLYQLLSKDYNIVKNPGSYNSQLGVPLSVWQIQGQHQLGLFEAGISKPGEMALLQKIIQPTVGIFTNIGTAHDEGFKDVEQKILEKVKLFEKTSVTIFCQDHNEVSKILHKEIPRQKLLSWGYTEGSTIKLNRIGEQEIEVAWQGKSFPIQFPFSDLASQENASHCLAAMLYLGLTPDVIQERIPQLKGVPMRLEIKQGINGCQIIDDTYNNDLGGLQICLNFLNGLQKKKKMVILSDIHQSGLEEKILVNKISEMMGRAGVHSFIGIGPILSKHQNTFIGAVEDVKFYPTTDAFLEGESDQFQNEVILIKGGRVFKFEKIVQRLQKKIHGTVMEVDLGAMVHNLNFFRSKLNPNVKLMVMVKAFAYGSGSEEVAGLLQYHKVDYLGVAYADEGVELRKNHILLPIMVMNPAEESFHQLVKYNLEPEVYSISLLKSLLQFLDGKPCKVHLKMDTGMHRLGFEEQHLTELIQLLKSNNNISVTAIFSHLAGADTIEHDNFSRDQATRFVEMTTRLKNELQIKPILHLLNSSGILRFPDLQFDMVRLGIGLYGVNPTDEKFDQLKPVATLKTIISQVKIIQPGESIGYGRKGRAEKITSIATIAIGYADGFNRTFSNGAGKVLVNGKLAPVIGNVCMDMTMIDITSINAKEGDEVIIFGKELPIQNVAASINTIPYEILTNTSERVKRVFYAESI